MGSDVVRQLPCELLGPSVVVQHAAYARLRRSWGKKRHSGAHHYSAVFCRQFVYCEDRSGWYINGHSSEACQPHKVPQVWEPRSCATIAFCIACAASMLHLKIQAGTSHNLKLPLPRSTGTRAVEYKVLEPRVHIAWCIAQTTLLA
eukprot:6385457-Amphidinium_carterae.1